MLCLACQQPLLSDLLRAVVLWQESASLRYVPEHLGASVVRYNSYQPCRPQQQVDTTMLWLLVVSWTIHRCWRMAAVVAVNMQLVVTVRYGAVCCRLRSSAQDMPSQRSLHYRGGNILLAPPPHTHYTHASTRMGDCQGLRSCT